MFLSDHHPISMTLEFADTPNHSLFWRLDPALVSDPAIVSTIHQHLQHYFTENNSPKISPLTKWEAQKCVIHGELVAQAVRCRWERQARIDSLITRIHMLELAHKMSQATFSLQELQQIRADLLEELNKKIKRNYVLSQKIFYEYANKSGKLLARALLSKKA